MLSPREDLVRRRLNNLGARLALSNLRVTVAVFHAYLCWLQDGTPLPNFIEAPPPQHSTRNALRLAGFAEWQIEFVLREAFLRSGESKDADIRTWPVVSAAIERSKTVTSALYRRTNDPTLILNRIAFQQFPWQQNRENEVSCRYLVVYSDPNLEAYIVASHGLNTSEVIKLAYGLVGIFSHYSFLDNGLDWNVDDMDPARVQDFVRSLILSKADFLAVLEDTRTYDDRMIYGASPFVEWPLIEFDDPAQICCPIPTRLWQRIVEGLYYDCIRQAGPNIDHFSRQLGVSFEKYTLLQLARRTDPVRGSVFHEVVYGTPQRPNKTCDILWEFNGVRFLVECKAVRLRIDSRNADELTENLKRSLNSIVESVVKIHQTVWDAEQNRFNSPLPLSGHIYGIVSMMDEWFLLAQSWTTYIDSEIDNRLAELEIPANVRNRISWRVLSSDQLDKLAFAMSVNGYQTILTSLFGEARWHHPGNCFIDFFANHQVTFSPIMTDQLEALME